MRWTRVITRCQIRRGEARRAGWKSLLSALRFACFRAAASVTRDRYPGGNRRTPRRWCLLHDSLFARSRHVKHLSAPLLFAQSSKPFGRRWLNRFLLLVSFNLFDFFCFLFLFFRRCWKRRGRGRQATLCSFEGFTREEDFFLSTLSSSFDSSRCLNIEINWLIMSSLRMNDFSSSSSSRTVLERWF